MPVYKTIEVNTHTKIWIWKIQEDIETLLEGIPLTENCVSRIVNMKSLIHKKGFLSVRQLLNRAGYSARDLFYDANGKPNLKDGKQISITHSFEFSAIIISDTPIGIDIEKQRDKIQKIAKKFTLKEQNYLTDVDLTRKLSVIWCAKEALYKRYSQKGLSFKTHIEVLDFALETQKTQAITTYKHINQTDTIAFLEFEGFTCGFAY